MAETQASKQDQAQQATNCAEAVHVRVLRDFLASLPAELGGTRRTELRGTVQRMLDEGFFGPQPAQAQQSIQSPAPAPDEDKALTNALEERDAASDYIDALLDEVLGKDRNEWTSNYGHAEAMKEVRERMAALAAMPAQSQDEPWVPVTERLPDFMQGCDWLFPFNEIKRERWILCCESMATATVPGRATHWRPAKPLPQ